jgi:hypothetical protein
MRTSKKDTAVQTPPTAPKTPLETAREHLNAWLEADLKVSTHQSYTIGSRSLTMANLAEIRKQIEYWSGKAAQLESAQNRGGRNRLMRVVPRDL